MRAKRTLPELSRFELQCLSKLWELGEGTVRDIHTGLGGAPSYSTVRKIVERLEEKGAVQRVRQAGSAWVYRSEVARTDMVRKEIKRLLDSLFGGSGAPLVSHLADMQAVTLDDLRAVEAQLDDDDDQTTTATEAAQATDDAGGDESAGKARTGGAPPRRGRS